MSEIGVSEEMLKRALKDALMEVLEERRDFLREVLADVLDDLENGEPATTRRRRDMAFTLHQGEA